MTIDPRLKQILADIFRMDPAQVTAETAAGVAKGWDSLGHLQLVLAIESEFNLQFEPDEIPTLTSAGLIQQVLTDRGLT
jgi:acyl carrier protein